MHIKCPIMKRKFKVMVNNSTKINKMNNYLSSQTTEHKNTMTYVVGNPSLGLGQAQKCGRLTRLIV